MFARQHPTKRSKPPLPAGAHRPGALLPGHRDGHAAVVGVVEGDVQDVGLSGECLDGHHHRVERLMARGVDGLDKAAGIVFA